MLTQQAEVPFVYNFEVEGNHNYFVIAKDVEGGTTAVLAHNMCAKASTNSDDEYGQTCILVHNVTFFCRGGNPNPNWGKERLVKELHDEGFKLKGPSSSGGGLIYQHPETGEIYRIMPQPKRPPFRMEPRAKFENDFYYRYQANSNVPEGIHVTIPNH